MLQPDAFLHFLHSTHLFASTVREILEEKYLRQTTGLMLSFPQFNLIRLIASNDDSQIGEIATLLGISQAAASKNVDKLVHLGLVSRQIRHGNRRSSSLALTLRGKLLIQKYESLKEEKLNKVFCNFTQDELNAITCGLEKLAYLILTQEEELENTCVRCRAYWVKDCALRPLSEGCIYTRNPPAAMP